MNNVVENYNWFVAEKMWATIVRMSLFILLAFNTVWMMAEMPQSTIQESILVQTPVGTISIFDPFVLILFVWTMLPVLKLIRRLAYDFATMIGWIGSGGKITENRGYITGSGIPWVATTLIVVAVGSYSAGGLPLTISVIGVAAGINIYLSSPKAREVVGI